MGKYLRKIIEDYIVAKQAGVKLRYIKAIKADITEETWKNIEIK